MYHYERDDVPPNTESEDCLNETTLRERFGTDQSDIVNVSLSPKGVVMWIWDVVVCKNDRRRPINKSLFK